VSAGRASARSGRPSSCRARGMTLTAVLCWLSCRAMREVYQCMPAFFPHEARWFVSRRERGRLPHGIRAHASTPRHACAAEHGCVAPAAAAAAAAPPVRRLQMEFVMVSYAELSLMALMSQGLHALPVLQVNAQVSAQHRSRAPHAAVVCVCVCVSHLATNAMRGSPGSHRAASIATLACTI
jgi:hypothetical protein